MPSPTLREVKRAIWGLALLVPLALLGIVVGRAMIDGEIPAAVVLPAVGAGLVGVSLTTALLWLYIRLRFLPIIAAAERIAAGDLNVSVEPAGRGLVRRMAEAVNAIVRELAETNDEANTDRLTGVANRQALLVALFNEVERATRYTRPLSVAFVDIDHFKQVNDTHGHEAGDIVLRGIAQLIRANLRATDMIGRYGGEEFMLLLTETGVDDAAALAEKLRQLIERQGFAVEGNPSLNVTVSIGIAGGQGQQLRTDALVRDADAAMYSAKALGRNQTYAFAEPDDDARVPRAPISNHGRARAAELGRAARDAAQQALQSVIVPLPHYRGQPSALIASIVDDIARNMDLPDAEVDRIRLAALLHDIGKVAVPEEILEKPAALTSAEWRTVVQHPRIGQVILEQATILRDAVPIILHHHERYSGHGYPYGLRGGEIPLGARIVAVADAYDAMVHDRPYKRAISHDAAIAELKRHAGTQFDPEVVQRFCDLYAHRPPTAHDHISAQAGLATTDAPFRPHPIDGGQAIGDPKRRRPKAEEGDPSTIDPTATHDDGGAAATAG
jgi:diguanylate cyclase (GGDEF)-like protein